MLSSLQNMLITNSDILCHVFRVGGGGVTAMNGVFWGVLLCDVEIYQCFGGTAVSVCMLEDSILWRNVKIKLYVIFTKVT
jgi:hypothetical protein